MKSKEEILNFFDNEAALGFCTNEYALRLKWYFATYYNEYAQQSQPSGMRWVDDVNKIRGQAKAFGDKYSGSISEQAAAEVGFNAAINQVINILSEPSPAGAAEGASEGISKIREVMNWISQCVDEDHDLEVSEIKMIWNDLSDAISLIESTPHSSEGMAEALRDDIKKLDELRRLHIEPYNLGEMGEISRTISRLVKLASLSPASNQTEK